MYNLYLDESGILNLRDQGVSLSHFCIAGLIVNNDSSKFINERAKQIKFKFFNDTKVVFHAYEIVNNDGPFSIFKDNKKLKDDFIKDLCDFLSGANYKIIYIGINKQDYIDNDPQIRRLYAQKIPLRKYENAIARKMIQHVFKNYLCYLSKKSKKDKLCSGQITIEGAGMDQDSRCFQAFHELLGGVEELSMTTTDVRNHLTCISFATKKNHSVEIEMADMTAYFLNLEHRYNDGRAKKIKEGIKPIIDIFRKKTFDNKCSGLPSSSWQNFTTMQKPQKWGSC